MIKPQRFFKCKHCGNIAELIFDSGVRIVCCGEKMQELIPNTTDAANEKHVPVITVYNNEITVTIGSVLHPSLPEHNIEWIYLQTDKGFYRKTIGANNKPETKFLLSEDEKPITAYGYCNLHGLWKKDID